MIEIYGKFDKLNTYNQFKKVRYYIILFDFKNCIHNELNILLYKSENYINTNRER